jgi:hypothetical protein
MTRIINIEKVKKNLPIIQHNSRHNLMKVEKNKGKRINKEKTNKEAKEVKEKAKKTNKEAKEAKDKEKKKAKKTNKEAKEAKEKAKKAKEEEKKNKKDAKDLKNEINSFHKKKNYIKEYKKIGPANYEQKCRDFLKKIEDSKLDIKSKSNLEKKIRITQINPLHNEVNSLYKKENYKIVERKIKFEEFQKKCIELLKINLKINKDMNLERKIQKMYNYAIDNKNYDNIVFGYEDEPIQDIIHHLYVKFKIKDYSIKNINKVQEKLMNQFQLPIFRKYIRDDFKELKKRIKLDKYSTFFNKKSIENKRNNMKELKKDILLDNNEGGVGINEQLMQNPLNNLDDDRKRKKKVIIKDNYVQQKLS